MPKTGLVYHDVYLEHGTGEYHPESPQRLKAIIEVLNSSLPPEDLHRLDLSIHPRADIIQWIEQAHRSEHVHTIQSHQPSQGLGSLDGDTTVSPRSYPVSLLAVEGTLTAVDAVMNHEISNAFCAVRPPGHHAESNRAMGFCLFNNVAIAARYIQKRHHLKNILIIDWDVHHGNGTQEIFYDDPSVFYFSLHQHPLYPGTGSPEERGRGKGDGFTRNCPLSPGKGDLEYVGLFDTALKPIVDAFHPDFILISAGFDAHRDDPLANMRVTEAGFIEMTQKTLEWANQYCQGRIVSCLEGGYDLKALARSVRDHVKTLSITSKKE